MKEATTVVVRIFKGENIENSVAEIRLYGGEILRRAEGKNYIKLRVKIGPEEVTSVARINGILWVNGSTHHTGGRSDPAAGDRQSRMMRN